MSKVVKFIIQTFDNLIKLNNVEISIFYDKNTDFIIIANNINLKFNNETFPSNVSFLNRNNIGYDFGGWSDALLTNNLYENYDKFIFVNSSALGPFLRPDCKGKWTDIYINGLQNDIKLFGSTINTCNDPLNKSHVQSYIFSMDKTTLQYLIECEIFSITNYVETFEDAIWLKEVLMSRKIIENNWNIGALMKYYKDQNIDFTFKTKKPEEYNIEFLNDIMYQEFRNVMWNEYGLVFIKGNRINLSTIS